MRNHLHGSNVFEQTLYLGVSTLCILLLGVACVMRNKFAAGHRTLFLFFTFSILWMYFLSLPPYFSIGDIQVPTLSFFSHYLAPMVRAYARFGIFVNFFLACATSVVLAHLYQHMKRVHFFALIGVLLPMLIFEYWSIPGGYLMKLERPPEVYQWLSKQPGDLIVAEYPMMNRDESSASTYFFWQRIHKKKLINGTTRDNEKAWSFFEEVNDLGNPQTPALLKSVGVKYVIIHGSMYQDGPVPAPNKRYYPDEYAKTTYNNGLIPSVPFPLKLVKTFGTDFVFSLEKSENPQTNLPL